jgi:hypothetical protein
MGINGYSGGGETVRQAHLHIRNTNKFKYLQRFSAFPSITFTSKGEIE